MLTIYTLLIVAVMATLSRLAGGGVLPHPEGQSIRHQVARRLPEIAIGALSGTSLYLSGLSLPVSLILALVVFFGYETGHGTAWGMGRSPWVAQSGRKQFLSAIVDPICNRYSIQLGSFWYCAIFMAIKGFWICISFGPLAGIIGALVWPYMYSFKDQAPLASSEIAEWYLGGFMGLLIAYKAMPFLSLL